jgi:dTDP-4-dehydrorhamnose 3,5-epimerase
VIFTETRLKGAFLLEPEKIADDRGFFARIWCQREFQRHGLNPSLVQCSLSFNRKNGTIRGMHYQESPHEEAKLVQCIRGTIYDVIIDLCTESPTFGQWLGVELNAETRRMLYVPERFAHGFQTLADNTEVLYYISAFYTPDFARGIRWNDPAFAITWPRRPTVISDRDQGYPDFRLGR